VVYRGEVYSAESVVDRCSRVYMYLHKFGDGHFSNFTYPLCSTRSVSATYYSVSMEERSYCSSDPTSSDLISGDDISSELNGCELGTLLPWL